MENLDESLTKVPLSDIARTPLAYSLYVVVIVLLGVIGSLRWDKASDKRDCETEKVELQNQVKAERSEKDAFFRAYFVERSANQQIQKTVDSAAVEKSKEHEK